MPSNKAVLAAAALAAVAGAVASLYFQPTIAYKLAGTELGQRALGYLLAAKAPAPPAGLKIAERGGIVPSMTLRALDGQPVEVPQAWAGKPTLVNVWASWCGPCLKEMPDLQAFSAQHAANGVQVVGIALDDAPSARAMLARLGITYPNLIDAPGPTDAGVRLGNPAGVLPYSVLVSADGRVLKTRIGPFASASEIATWADLPRHTQSSGQ
jgi:thiol-disulfide isomerase/thioredoxin